MGVGSDVRAWRCSRVFLRHKRASDISYVRLWRRSGRIWSAINSCKLSMGGAMVYAVYWEITTEE